jgi:hypothetical protein
MINLPIESETSIVIGRQNASRTRLIGETTVPGFTVDDLSELLHPTEWQRLTDGRITMDPVGDGPSEDGARLYQETFKVTTSLRLTPLLRVVTKSHDGPPRARWLEYRLADPQDQSPGEVIQVDQGSIFIRDVGDGVRITATKRLLFTPPFDAPNLALLADPIGYFDAFENMVLAALPVNARPAPD